MIAAIWTAVSTFVGRWQVVLIAFAAVVAVTGGTIYFIYHRGEEAGAAQDDTRTLERATDANKPVTDPERDRVRREYERHD